MDVVISPSHLSFIITPVAMPVTSHLMENTLIYMSSKPVLSFLQKFPFIIHRHTPPNNNKMPPFFSPLNLNSFSQTYLHRTYYFHSKSKNITLIIFPTLIQSYHPYFSYVPRFLKVLFYYFYCPSSYMKSPYSFHYLPNISS
jgi:hypothetical protein